MIKIGVASLLCGYIAEIIHLSNQEFNDDVFQQQDLYTLKCGNDIL